MEPIFWRPWGFWKIQIKILFLSNIGFTLYLKKKIKNGESIWNNSLLDTRQLSEREKENKMSALFS